MKPQETTAEVFLTAFKTMTKKEQDIFLSEVLKDKKIREDMIDIAIGQSRLRVKSRSFRDFLKTQK